MPLPKDHLVKPALTRREVVVRGSLALATGSFLGRVAEDMAAAGARPARNWTLGAFVNPANERLTFAAAQREKRLESLVGRKLGMPAPSSPGRSRFRTRATRSISRAHVAHRLGRHRGSEHDRLRPLGRAPRRTCARVPRLRWADLPPLGAGVQRRVEPVLRPAARVHRCLAASRDHVPLRRRDERALGLVSIRRPGPASSGRGLAALLPRRPVRRLGRDGRLQLGTARSWSRWQSFAEIFTPLYVDYARRKPLLICEVASAGARRRQGRLDRGHG